MKQGSLFHLTEEEAEARCGGCLLGATGQVLWTLGFDSGSRHTGLSPIEENIPVFSPRGRTKNINFFR